MLNYWWVTRPKRKLNSIPEVLAAFADLSLNEEWDGQRNSHLAYEDALEQAGLKRKGERRDHVQGILRRCSVQSCRKRKAKRCKGRLCRTSGQ